MKFQFPYSPNFFKDTLEYAEQIKQQETECRKAFNYGSLLDISTNVRTLEMLITPKMIPNEDKFKEEIESLESKLNEHFENLDAKYNIQVKDALCPDVIPKPNRNMRPLWYHEEKFIILVNFLDRLGLGLQHEKEGHF